MTIDEEATTTTSGEEEKVGDAAVVGEPIIGTVSHGILDNNGNFMVVNLNSETLWGSFNHSTDTILPGQTLPLSSAYLYSRKAEDNFSQGRFRLRLDENGNLVLRMINIPSSFRTEPYLTHASGLNETSDIRGLNFNESGHLFISYGDHGKDLIFLQEEEGNRGAGEGFYYYRATLDSDGVFAVYRWRNEEPTWKVVWQIPKDICLTDPTYSGSGVCGFNRICRLNVNSRPDCQCPRPFTQDDPDDDYRSCVPGFIQSCGNGTYFPDDYDFYTQINIDWPLSDYEVLQPYTEETCKQDCLNDCMCAVAVHRTDNYSWKKKLPLSNGRVSPSVNRKTFIKFSKKNNTNSSSPHPDTVGRRKNDDALILLISLFLGGSGLVNVVLFVAISITDFLIYNKKILSRAKELGDNDILDKHLRCFTYRELEAATDSFKEEAGRGSFGIVYKGVLKTKTGHLEPIAVKKLDRIVQDIDLEFKTEVNVIGQTHHKNLVRLVGYCSEGENRLLVYEYLRNGSLAGFLFGELKLLV
ncbi:G-type lectin S-receptor-like serine/threonine-protein kinase LECRK2 [Impatiens glandulifera]|uniref:G-type lectin S-receptor-like serine/threonine-protein kinase LECRK2 n=1 Tax=Impatiens glandulifera TaxID=253017 RepID=UPI001FB0B664|nr:G-type lectin S-receptor-like serine/threonine-protein kinase LECRK2 [Impatiens glandulifera]